MGNNNITNAATTTTTTLNATDVNSTNVTATNNVTGTNVNARTTRTEGETYTGDGSAQPEIRDGIAKTRWRHLYDG